MSQDYNKTLNLPQTTFPMRASLPTREPEMLKEWDALDIYHKMVERNSGKPRFVLHDGPPFSNGHIHMGTVLNKCIKDFIIRYKNMSGWQGVYVPGWDNHGMPIESAIIKQNKLDRKKMSIPEFRDACRDFAAKFVDVQREQFLRLGVLGEWNTPYLTMAPRFEAEEVKIFGQMYQKGYIYRGKRPVYWCPHDETALAEAEIEYEERSVKSLYVKFPVADDLGKLSKYCPLDRLFFVIWTTTTWTIPGNLAICVGPELKYALAKAPRGEVYIVAKERLSALAKVCGIEEFEILAELSGSDLEFIKARHPLYDRQSIVLLGKHVTLDAGTGCVHTAPGHGTEDFEICRSYDNSGKTDIGVIVPVDDRGHMTAESGKYDGLYYEKANKAICEDLDSLGFLLASENISHQYAHCWRCRNPILYRVTDQWFCSVDAFKDDAVHACSEVEWLPSWGHDRMTAMIQERSDWCISRQRHWGLPIPVFYCQSCGGAVCTPETVEHVSKLFRDNGSNAWFSMDVRELIPETTKCPHCGNSDFYKQSDTLDCWFDSGSTHAASLAQDNPSDWPASMYLEGADQFRGWFQSSLLTAVATKGRAPYKCVLTHGWTVDGDGKQMHKSLGNGVYPEDVIPKYGADVLRLWSASSDYHADVRCSDKIFSQLSDTYLKIRNTARFILGNFQDFDPDKAASFEELLPLDQWAVSRLNELIGKARDAYERFEFHTVIHAVHNFCVVDMSNFYLDVIKDRLYCESKNNPARQYALSAMYYILDGIVRLVAPILAFTSNEIWQIMPHASGDDARHIMLNDMPCTRQDWRLGDDEKAKWQYFLKLRDSVNKALEIARTNKTIGKSLDAKVILNIPGKCAKEFASIEKFDLSTLLIISELEINHGDVSCFENPEISVEIEPCTMPKCVRCWAHRETIGVSVEHPEICERCARVLKF